jgi:hypothetical protein
MIPYIAIGNDELEQQVTEGDRITDGENEYLVTFTYSENKEMSLLTVKKADGKSYMVGIQGKLIHPWRRT